MQCRKKASRHVSRQALRDMIRKALDTGSLSGLHPTARVVEESIIVNSVRVEVFNILSTLLLDRSVSAHRRVKLDYLTRTPRSDRGAQARHGRLVVTMPGTLHEQFSRFSDQVKLEMVIQSFLPDILDPGQDIIQTGSASIYVTLETRSRNVQPDSSLAILHGDRPFLVVECAHSQQARHVRRKAEDYFIGASHSPQFVVVIYIDTPSSGMSTGATAANQSHRFTRKLTPQDRVSVTVFVPVVTPTNGGETVAMGTLIDRVEVYPTPATDNDYFTIKWCDVNCGPWADFLAKHQLPLDSPEPTCTVSLAYLSLQAQRIANPPSPPSEPAQRPRRRGVREPASSSPTLPSSGSEMPSEEERRLDPDYEQSSD